MGGSKMDIKTSVASSKMSTKSMVGYALIGLVVFLMPIIFQGFGQLFLVRILAIVGLYVMLALGLNIVVGIRGPTRPGLHRVLRDRCVRGNHRRACRFPSGSRPPSPRSRGYRACRTSS